MATSAGSPARANHDQGNGKSQDQHSQGKGKDKEKDKHQEEEDCAFAVVPSVFDPQRTGSVRAAWVPGAGLPDDTGKSNFGLLLQKTSPIATNAAAVAEVEGVQGITLSELGFDVRNDSLCTAGSPRFNVTTDVGVYYFFGCYYGIHTPIPGTNFTRVRFTNADAFPATPTTPPFPGFGSLTVQSIELVFDETGFAVLDNIDINGTLIGRPGVVQCAGGDEDDDHDHDHGKKGNGKD